MLAKNQVFMDENLLEGELPIKVFFNDKAKLTTHRLRFELSQSEGRILSSIFLDSISLIQLRSTKQIILAIGGFVFILLGIFSYMETYLDLSIFFSIIGVILLILYFFIEKME